VIFGTGLCSFWTKIENTVFSRKKTNNNVNFTVSKIDRADTNYKKTPPLDDGRN
jgi:hypothetical protein